MFYYGTVHFIGYFWSMGVPENATQIKVLPQCCWGRMSFKDPVIMREEQSGNLQ